MNNNRTDQSAVVPTRGSSARRSRRPSRRAVTPAINPSLDRLAAAIALNSATPQTPSLPAAQPPAPDVVVSLELRPTVEMKEEKTESHAIADQSPAVTIDISPPYVQTDDLCCVCRSALGRRFEQFSCGHRFHVTCAMQAIANDPRCPTCRDEVSPSVYVNMSEITAVNAVGDAPPPPALALNAAAPPPVPRPITIVAGHSETRVEIQPIEVSAGRVPRTVYLGMLISLSIACVFALGLGPVQAVAVAIFLFAYQLYFFRAALRLWSGALGARMVYSSPEYYDDVRNCSPEQLRQFLRSSPSAPRQIWWYLSLSIAFDRFMQLCCVGAGIQNKIETGRIVSFRFYRAELPAHDVRPVTNRTVRMASDPVMLELGIFESRIDMTSRYLIISPEVRNSVVPQLSTINNADRYSLSATRSRAGIAPLGVDSALADEVIESTALAAHVQANNNDMSREGIMVAMGLKAPARQDSCNMVSDTVCLIIFLCGLCLLAALGSISSLLSGQT